MTNLDILTALRNGTLSIDDAAAQLDTAPSRRFEVELGEYNGHPTMTFTGDFRKFTIGCGKVRTILDNQDEILRVLPPKPAKKSNGNTVANSDGTRQLIAG